MIASDATGYTVTARPMTDAERELIIRAMKSSWVVGGVFGVIGMFFSILNYLVVDMLIFYGTLIVGFITLIICISTLQSRHTLTKFLNVGTVTEVSGVPVKNSKGWVHIGPAVVIDTKAIATQMPEGRTATLAYIPQFKLAVSLNGVPLKNAVSMFAPKGGATVSAKFGRVATPIQPTPVAQTPTAPAVTVPPRAPTALMKTCPYCGASIPQEAEYCPNCKLKQKK